MLDEKGIILNCPNCAKKNRIAYARLGLTGLCGHCKTALPPPASPIDIPDSPRFSLLIEASPLPVLIDCWAEWCAPCRFMSPEIDRIAAKHAGKWIVAKVDTDQQPELSRLLNIQTIPTLFAFVGGREIARSSGARPFSGIETFMRAAMEKIGK